MFPYNKVNYCVRTHKQQRYVRVLLSSRAHTCPKGAHCGLYLWMVVSEDGQVMGWATARLGCQPKAAGSGSGLGRVASQIHPWESQEGLCSLHSTST